MPGFILPPFLIILAVVMLLVAALADGFLALSGREVSSRILNTLRQHTLAQFIHQIEQGVDPSPPCFIDNSATNLFCISQRSSRRNSAELINFEEIFRSASLCRHPAAVHPDRSPFAAVSAWSCGHESIAYTGNNVFNGNLEVSSSLELQTADPAVPVILAASGEMRLSQAVRLNSSAIIVAGGDLRIDRLQAERPLKVVLLSATGQIEIATISDNLLISLNARSGWRLPPQTKISIDSPPLPRRRILLHGMVATP